MVEDGVSANAAIDNQKNVAASPTNRVTSETDSKCPTKADTNADQGPKRCRSKDDVAKNDSAGLVELNDAIQESHNIIDNKKSKASEEGGPRKDTGGSIDETESNGKETSLLHHQIHFTYYF